MSYLPEGPEPPGPTAQVLPSWLSYSPAATNVATYASTHTRIIYDPEGTEPPRETLQVQTGVTTSIQYTIKYRPLEYTGPFPAPDLGSLYTTPGQQQATNSPNATPTNGSNGGVSNGAGNRPRPSNSANNGQGAGNSQQGQGNGQSRPGGSQGNGASATGDGNSGNASPSASNGNTPAATASGNQPSASASASNNNPPSAASPFNGSAAANTLSSLASIAATATGASQSSAAASLSAAASSASAAASSASDSSLASQASAAASSASANSARPSSSSSSIASSSSASPSSSASSSTGAPTNGLLPPPIPQNRAAGLSGGQIAGIVLGVFFFLLLLLLLLLCCLRRRRRRAEEGGAAAGGVMGQHGRRISDRFASAWTGGGGGGAGGAGGSGGGGPGAYAPLAGAAGAAGVAGAAPALAAAGASRECDADSDDWEADHLTGGDGSGFFVVGGRRRGEGGSGSWRSRRSSGAPGGYGPGGIGRGSPPSALSSLREAPGSAGGGQGAGRSGSGGAGKGLFGGLLAGSFLARHLGGRNKQGNAVPTHDPDETGDEEDVTSYANVGRAHLEGDDLDEGRGLMGGYGGGQPEMQQAGPSHWGGWPSIGAAAGAGAAGLGAGYAARRRNRYSSDDDDAGDAEGDLGAAGGSSGNGTSSGRAHDSYGSASQGPGSSAQHSNGAGGVGGDPNAANRSRQGSLTTPSPLIGASLPPPPRPARERSGSSPNVLANLPEAGPSRQRDTRIPSYGSDFGTGDIGYDPKLLGAAGGAAAAGGGLAAWAAGHRDSQGSTYSKGHYPSGAPTGSNNNSGDSLGGRHSKFISADTNLLGPGAGGGNSSGTPSPSDEDHGGDGAAGAAAASNRRLPTIQSVGEFGERGSQVSGPRDMPSTSAQQGTVNSSEGSKGRSRASYVTTEEDPSSGQPPNSPRGTMGQRRSTTYSEALTDGGELHGDDGESSGQDDADEDDPFSDRPSSSRSGLASTAAAGGLLSGLAAGFRRLTMGVTPSAAPSSRDGYDEAEQQRDASGSSHLAEPHQPGANIKSQQASVYTGDSGSHSRHGQQSSGSGSGGNASSGAGIGLAPAAAGAAAAGNIERPMTRASARSGADSVFDSETHGAGYAASASDNSSSGASRQRSGRSVASSLSTGVDSTSWRAQGSSGGSSSSGSRRGRAMSPFSDRGGERSDLAHASSGQATTTAGGNIGRTSTVSSRGGVSSISGRAAYAGARHGGREDGSSSFASVPTADEYGEEGRGGEMASSRATAGGESRRAPSNPFEDESEDGAQPLPQPPYAVEGGAGVRRLSSVREGPEDEQGASSSQGHYPSASVGEAALRQSQREGARDPRRRPAGGSVRGLPSSLIPGYGGPGSPVGAAGGSDSWRQSPRVESLGRQAAAAAAAANQQGGEGGGRREEGQGQGSSGTSWGGGLL